MGPTPTHSPDSPPGPTEPSPAQHGTAAPAGGGPRPPIWKEILRGLAARPLTRKFAQRTGQTVVMLAVVTVCGIYAYTAWPPSLASLWAVERESGITILGSRGEMLAIRGGYYGEDIKVDELPPHLVQAFLAIEDRRFYDHWGFDFRGMARAMLANLSGNGGMQGGSTISQQLARNLFLSHDRTLIRKLAEGVHTLRLERHLTKDQILSLYLNRIYLGAGTYGVDGAARFYFGKSAREVSLAEAAMLAGLPKAPSRNAPTADLNRAQRRAALVLAGMVKEGYIDAAREQEANNHPAVPVERPGTDNLGFFVDAALAEAGNLLGPPPSDIVVETTIDIGLQNRAEHAVATVMDSRSEALRAHEAAFVAFSPDGALRALVGGRSYAQSQFNRATQARRQPGSAFKPFVYLAALEHGMSYRDRLHDRPVRVGNWTPENYDGGYRGELTLSEALEQSVNTVAVQLSERVGRANVIKAARRLGVKSEIANHPSLALGTAELSLFELTSAYLPFANTGLTAGPHMIVRITTKDGDVLYERPPFTPERVIARDVAETMTYMLYQTVERGTGRNAGLAHHPVAGKTGTSQDHRDAWFIGYSAYYVAGVWVGNDDATPMAGVTGADLPSEIWRLVMTDAHAGKRARALPGAYRAERGWLGRRESGIRRFFKRLGRDLGVSDGRED